LIDCSKAHKKKKSKGDARIDETHKRNHEILSSKRPIPHGLIALGAGGSATRPATDFYPGLFPGH